MLLEAAQSQLERTLSFFPRIESKSSFLFAINIGMLAVAFTNLSYKDISTWYIVLPLFASLICAAFAIYHVGLVVRPELTGSKSSLIYFMSISNFSDTEYIDKFSSLSKEDFIADILRQTHRNSEILAEKFLAVSKSLFWTTLSVLPWALYLILSSVHNSQIVKVSP